MVVVPRKYSPSSLFVAAFLVTVGATQSASASQVVEFAPTTVVTVTPRTPPEDVGGKPQLPNAEDRTETTIEPALFAELKKRAETDPTAAETATQEVPVVLPPSSEAFSALATTVRSFPGLGYSDAGFPIPPTSSTFVPSDTILGKGTSTVIEAVNGQIRLYSPNGAILANKSLNNFFAASPTPIYDPRVVWDKNSATPRYFVIAQQHDNTAHTSTVHIAVSRAPNPANLENANWCLYIISPPSGGTTWSDFPMIGLGTDTVLISTNEWSFGPSFHYQFSYLWVFHSKANLESCTTTSATVFTIPGTVYDQETTGFVQPAVHYTPPTSFTGVTNPAYMVSTRLPPSKIYRVWRAANAASHNPTLQMFDVTASADYFVPLNVTQPGTSVLLKAKDTRVEQTVGMADTIWATHVTNCLDATTQTNKACVRAVRLVVGNPGGNFNATMAEDVTFASPNGNGTLAYFMPGIAATSSGHTAVSLLAGSSTLYLSAGYTTKLASSGSYGPVTITSAGDACSRTTVTNTVGDYSGAHTNPNDLASFWLAAERSVQIGTSCVWGSHIVQVTP